MKAQTSRSRRRITAMAITVSALVGGGLLSASPAFAANVGTYSVNCASTSYSVQFITAAVGDTVTITNTGTGPCDVLVGGGATSSGTVAADGLAAGDTDTFTFTDVGLNFAIVADNLYPSNQSNYGIALVATVSADVAPTVSAAEYLQQLPVPASGSCADVKDADYAWNTGVTGGWSKAWGDWNHNWVCSRVLTNAGGTWHTTNS